VLVAIFSQLLILSGLRQSTFLSSGYLRQNPVRYLLLSGYFVVVVIILFVSLFNFQLERVACILKLKIFMDSAEKGFG